nr:protein phosphatase 2C domain-containing protein [Fimbriiglobus ruber]
MDLRYASLSNAGTRRSHNQDACASYPARDATTFQTRGHLFIVADGMGGQGVGDKVSKQAVEDISLMYLGHVARDGPEAAIRRAFRAANEAIYDIGQSSQKLRGLGSTGTALFIRPEGAWIGHVGDSRAYRIRGNRIQQLTFDHSWVWEIARIQGIDPDEFGFQKNVIIRSLGLDAEVETDIEGPHPVEPGDRFLLCSDGLSNVVSPDELGAIVSAFPPDEACRYLVVLANLRGGPDNITCVVVQAPDVPEASRWSGMLQWARSTIASHFRAKQTGDTSRELHVYRDYEFTPGKPWSIPDWPRHFD